MREKFHLIVDEVHTYNISPNDDSELKKFDIGNGLVWIQNGIGFRAEWSCFDSEWSCSERIGLGEFFFSSSWHIGIHQPHSCKMSMDIRILWVRSQKQIKILRVVESSWVGTFEMFWKRVELCKTHTCLGFWPFEKKKNKSGMVSIRILNGFCILSKPIPFCLKNSLMNLNF